MVSFGELFVCNDNLVTKFKTGAVLNESKYCAPADRYRYFYFEAELGYTDLSVFEPPKKDEEVAEMSKL